MSIDWLREIPLLSGFSDEDLESLAVIIRREEFAPEAILFREGEAGDRFGMILRGEVVILQALGTPEERMLRTIEQGGFVGEMSLFDPKGVRSASVQAREAVELACITRQDFTNLLERQPALALRFLQELIIRIRRSETHIIGDLRAKNKALVQAYHDLKQAQSALIEKEKLERELEIARVIQKSILPRQIIEVPGWQIATHWQPARSVSGDFYDIFPYPDGHVDLLIADVTGKGMSAALMMATTCSMLRAVASSEISPGSILERVNNLLCLNMPPNMFVTCLYGNLDPARGVFRFANAGHCLPIKVSGGGVQELWAAGMPLGLLPGMTYEENETRLEPGEGFLLYTDGLAEAHNDRREMFGLPRLHHCLAGCDFGLGAIDDLLTALTEFSGEGQEQEDDVTLFAVVHSPIH